MAVLFLGWPDQRLRARAGIWRRWKTGGALLAVSKTGGDIPGALRAGRPHVLLGHAVSREVSRRRVHLVPRIVESGARAAGGLQHRLPAVCRRIAVRQIRSLRRRVQGTEADYESRQRARAARWDRPGTGWFAVRDRQRKRKNLAHHL